MHHVLKTWQISRVWSQWRYVYQGYRLTAQSYLIVYHIIIHSTFLILELNFFQHKDLKMRYFDRYIGTYLSNVNVETERSGK